MFSLLPINGLERQMVLSGYKHFVPTALGAPIDFEVFQTGTLIQQDLQQSSRRGDASSAIFRIIDAEDRRAHISPELFLVQLPARFVNLRFLP